MDTNELMVATYNIQLSLNVKSITQNIVEMAKKGVIVFCLQEVMRQPDRQFIIDALMSALGKKWLVEYAVGEGPTHTALGTALLWNSELLHNQKISKILIPKIKRMALHELMFAILIGGTLKPVQRRTITGLFLYKNKQVQITSIHVDHVGGSMHRNKQLLYVRDQMQGEKNAPYEIICGDFNTFDLLHTGQERKLIQKSLGKDFHDASDSIPWSADLYNNDMIKSFPLFKRLIKLSSLHIRCKLDYIWIKNFTISDCQELQLPGSDHYPLIAKLAFAKTER